MSGDVTPVDAEPGDEPKAASKQTQYDPWKHGGMKVARGRSPRGREENKRNIIKIRGVRNGGAYLRHGDKTSKRTGNPGARSFAAFKVAAVPKAASSKCDSGV